ncbi:MAG: sugar ABC transporter substrate-binding protein [Acidobacteria bacterium]|nr:sugar ABC transporter substrate-binding protein [Acidobacteriota bacterium]
MSRTCSSLSLLLVFLAAGCRQSGDRAGQPTVGVAFETLQTEYWVASRNAIEAELRKRNIRMLEAIADGDANRQFEQVRNFITRKVDGIIVVPKDAQTVIPMIRGANQANIPIVLFNRPPAKSDARSVTVVADNYSIARDTVAYMVQQALKSGKKRKAAILIGDLGDVNSIHRRDGFEDAIKPHADKFDVVARIPTEWNQEKALAGLTNALQAHPEIDFVFTSSDLLLPSIVSALKTSGKYKKIGEEGHVTLGGFDGDATAYRMLLDGYLDADGVQDVLFDTAATVQAVLDLKSGKQLPEQIVDNGFVIHQGNLKEMAPRMWGATVRKQ